MRSFVAFVFVVLLVLVARSRCLETNDELNRLARAEHNWQCDQIQLPVQLTPPGSAYLYSYTCNGSMPVANFSQLGVLGPLKSGPTGNLLFQVVVADITDDESLYVSPVTARTADAAMPFRQSLVDIAQEQQGRVVAAINGGYFSSPAAGSDTIVDPNCWTKSLLRYDNVSALSTFDIGDGLTIYATDSGQASAVDSWNCATLGQPGLPLRSTLTVNASGFLSVQRLPAGKFDYASLGIAYAVGGGPNLIDGESVAMEWQDIASTFELGAQSAVGIGQSPAAHKSLVMVTATPSEPGAGLHSYDMASFLATAMPYVLKVHVIQAMSLANGDATSMLIGNPASGKIESVAGTNPPTPIFNGLFVFRRGKA